MRFSYKVKIKKTGEFTEDYNQIMKDSDNGSGMSKFEALGMQTDGTPVVFDKCGKFGYLAEKYELVAIADKRI